MRILVTGGAGFIGSHLVDALVDRGDEVIVIDNFSTGNEANVNPRADVHRLDITSPEAARLVAGAELDAICHHAAQMSVSQSVKDPLFDARTNILGGLNMLEAAAAAGVRFVFASTGGALYGDADVLPTPEDYRPWPAAPYGVAKLAMEHYLHSFAFQGRIRYAVLRYGNVYGPRQNPHGEAGVVAIFCRALVEGRPPTINGDGVQTRDYVYVRDVVAATIAAMDDGRETGTYNVGTGRQVDVNRIFTLIRDSLGSEIEAVHGPAKPGEQRTSALDCARIRETLGWTPQTPLEVGIEETAAWFRDNPGR